MSTNFFEFICFFRCFFPPYERTKRRPPIPMLRARLLLSSALCGLLLPSGADTDRNTRTAFSAPGTFGRCALPLRAEGASRHEGRAAAHSYSPHPPLFSCTGLPVRALRAAAGATDDEGMHHARLQRKISLLSPPPGSSVGDLAELVSRSFKEVEQYRTGTANLHVQTQGHTLSLGKRSSHTTDISLPLSRGEIVVGDGDPSTDLLLHNEESGTGGAAGRNARVCEILVTLQGDRGLRGAHPASHVVGEPREGDDMSEERAALLDVALERQGEDAREILSPEFAGTAARRAYLSFVNPRPGKVSNSKETPEQAAARVAVQVCLFQKGLLPMCRCAVAAPGVMRAVGQGDMSPGPAGVVSATRAQSYGGRLPA